MTLMLQNSRVRNSTGQIGSDGIDNYFDCLAIICIRPVRPFTVPIIPLADPRGAAQEDDRWPASSRLRQMFGQDAQLAVTSDQRSTPYAKGRRRFMLGRNSDVQGRGPQSISLRRFMTLKRADPPPRRREGTTLRLCREFGPKGSADRPAGSATPGRSS
jgi:hypothetical protein